jgi:hypothetical protein
MEIVRGSIDGLLLIKMKKNLIYNKKMDANFSNSNFDFINRMVT